MENNSTLQNEINNNNVNESIKNDLTYVISKKKKMEYFFIFNFCDFNYFKF